MSAIISPEDKEPSGIYSNNCNSTPLASFKFPPKEEKSEDSSEDDDKDDYAYNVSIMPMISLAQGLQKKASPLTLVSWVKLALTLDGRDKITKVFQYSARMLAWWYAGIRQQNQVKRFKSVQTTLTTSRKAFRLGRSFIEIQKIRDSGFLELFLNPLKNSSNNNDNKMNDPAWKIVGNAMKMIGLMGFWAGDNVNFLTGGGLFDDYRVEGKERLARRNNLKTKAALFANRFYFFGAVAGLITSLRVYLLHRQTTIKEAHERLVEATQQVSEATTKQASSSSKSSSSQNVENNTIATKRKSLWRDAKAALDSAREKQFALFLAVLKGCVDVMVFSNNPGIDLHQKLRGRKNHEGLHCLCGLISASTVLYNNYPNAVASK